MHAHLNFSKEKESYSVHIPYGSLGGLLLREGSQESEEEEVFIFSVLGSREQQHFQIKTTQEI